MDEVCRKNGMKGFVQLFKIDMDSCIFFNKEGGYVVNFILMVMIEMQSGLIVVVDVLIGNVEYYEFVIIVDCVVNDFGIDIK